MTFHVSLTNAEKLDYADEDVYEFLEGGVLAIYRGEAFMDEYLAPTAWERVEASKGHKPVARAMAIRDRKNRVPRSSSCSERPHTIDRADSY